MLLDDKVNELIQSVESDNTMEWQCDWIARYTVVVKCRGVIKCKGYVVKLHYCISFLKFTNLKVSFQTLANFAQIRFT